MLPPAFYRSLLSQEEQIAYRRVVMALLQGRSSVEVEISASDSASLRRIMGAIHLDHPELCQVNFWEYWIGRTPAGRGCFQMMYLLEREQALAVRAAMEAHAAQVCSLLHGMTQTKQYRQLADLLCRTIAYCDTNNGFWEHTAGGAVLRGKAVCEGIAKLFLYDCQRLELPCAVVFGRLQGNPHAWNMVELDGVRRYVDVTQLLQGPPAGTLPTALLFRSEDRLHQTGYDWRLPDNRNSVYEVVF